MSTVALSAKFELLYEKEYSVERFENQSACQALKTGAEKKAFPNATSKLK
jgi:hypothetical protein